MLNTAYKDNALGKVYEWFSRFKSAEMVIDSKPRPGHLSLSITEESFAKIRALVLEDRRRTIDEL